MKKRSVFEVSVGTFALAHWPLPLLLLLVLLLVVPDLLLLLVCILFGSDCFNESTFQAAMLLVIAKLILFKFDIPLCFHLLLTFRGIGVPTCFHTLVTSLCISFER